MRRIYADSSYYVALLNGDDASHLVATSLASAIGRDSTSVITTDAVFVEVLTYMSARGTYSRNRAVRLIDLLREDNAVTILPSTRALFDSALELYRRRPDKSYSMTDCISMVVCRDEGVEGVLTADKDFQQEGFTILL